MCNCMPQCTSRISYMRMQTVLNSGQVHCVPTTCSATLATIKGLAC